MRDPIQQLRDQFNRQFAERDKRYEQVINDIVRRLNSTDHNAVQQQQKEILSHLYGSASAYTNLVILAGYGGIFGVWQLMRGHFSHTQELHIATLLTMSIVLFVGFEVYRSVRHGLLFRQLEKIITSKVPPQDQAKTWQAAWVEHSAGESRLWMFFVVPAVITGFSAALYLLLIFIRSI